MKKKFFGIAVALCLAFTITVGGCKNRNMDPGQDWNGGETQVETITTLEGNWLSEKNKVGGYEKIIVETASIRCYTKYDANARYVLEWAGVYMPFEGPISEGEWTFDDDKEYYLQHYQEMDGNGFAADPDPKTFYYSNGKLSCKMRSADGVHGIIYFTRIEE